LKYGDGTIPSRALTSAVRRSAGARLIDGRRRAASRLFASPDSDGDRGDWVPGAVFAVPRSCARPTFEWNG